MMAGLSSLLRLDPMFSIYQKIASRAQKTAPEPSPEGLIRLVDCDVTGGSWGWQLTWAWAPWQDAYHSTFAKQAKAAPASHQPPPPQGECQRRSSAFPLVALWSWQWGVQNSSVGQTREHQSCLSSQLWHSRHQKEGRNKERKKSKTKKEKKGEEEVSNSI